MKGPERFESYKQQAVSEADPPRCLPGSGSRPNAKAMTKYRFTLS
jgi:hypothetical protein